MEDLDSAALRRALWPEGQVWFSASRASMGPAAAALPDHGSSWTRRYPVPADGNNG